MAHYHFSSPATIQVSIDSGETWIELSPSFFLLSEEGDLLEITPDNPLYAELLQILEDA